MPAETAAVILAAGYSSRMGRHKALLRFDEKHNFIQKIIQTYKQAGIGKIVLVANNDNAELISESIENEDVLLVDMVVNEHPEWERFYSIKCGLAEVSDVACCFIHNCDNPFVPVNIIQQMMNAFEEDAVIIPEYKGERGHPVLLSHNIIEAVLSHPENSSNFKTFLAGFPNKIVSVDDPCILFNINTREDLQNCF
jgi:molybdenum cofactor cytidylyltransferase